MSNVGNLSDLVQVEVTPADWAFSIWSLIFILLFVFYGFLAFTTLKNDIYLKPEVANVYFLVATIASLVFEIAWLFVWDRKELVGAAVLLFAIALCNLIALAIFGFNLAKDNNALKRNKKWLYWTYTILGFNGTTIFATWTVIASLLNLCIALHYSAGLTMFASSILGPSALLVILVVWAALDMFVLDKYVRFLFAPHLVIIWATAAILDSPNDEGRLVVMEPAIEKIVKTVFGLVIIFLVVKLIAVIIREWRKPLGGGSDSVVKVAY